MTLQLNDKWRIVTEPNNFVLQELKEYKRKETKEVFYKWETEGCYGNEQQAIKGCLRHGLITKDLNGLEEIEEYLTVFTQEIINQMHTLPRCEEDLRGEE
jgi:hypothetical protein